MPNGKVHATATIAATFGSPLMMHYFWPAVPISNVAAVAAGCSLGIILTPDLDVNQGCASMRAIRRRLGKPASQAWRLLWLPYALTVPHRSWLSHFPLVGTALRLGYLYLLYFIIALLVGSTGLAHMPEINLSPVLLQNSIFIWIFAGLCLADTMHFFMDRTLRSD